MPTTSPSRHCQGRELAPDARGALELADGVPRGLSMHCATWSLPPQAGTGSIDHNLTLLPGQSTGALQVPSRAPNQTCTESRKGVPGLGCFNLQHARHGMTKLDVTLLGRGRAECEPCCPLAAGARHDRPLSRLRNLPLHCVRDDMTHLETALVDETQRIGHAVSVLDKVGTRWIAW